MVDEDSFAMFGTLGQFAGCYFPRFSKQTKLMKELHAEAGRHHKAVLTEYLRGRNRFQ
jgi:hypothetical protein